MRQRVALVTGAGNGIGRATALALARDGCDVALVDRDADGLERTRGSIDGSRTVSVLADVTVRDQVETAVAEAVAGLGGLDVVVNAAGIAQIRPFLELTETDWRKVIDVNLTGTFHVGRAAARAMVRSDGGAIVNLASTAGKIGRAQLAHDCASKWGVIGLSHSMALALAGDGIRVNAVCPGIIDTRMWEGLDAEIAGPEGLQIGDAMRARVADIPLGRAGTAEEVADLITFLASDRARYITGQAVNVSGGFVTH
jgi:NAD(P)-dependent dehydrogenase (short-subunit alcohol dehydrogenase family)